MIISEVIGGLGNQMFQYAAGWSLAEAKKTIFKLDISAYSYYSMHKGYELDRVFSLQSAFASAADLKQILGWQRYSLCRRVIKRPYFSSLRKTSLLLESGFAYSDLRPRVSDLAYISGYWQSEKYFLNYANEIREKFTFAPILDDANKKWAELIARKNSVSIHVRRGDFFHGKNASYHGVCTVDYFASAIRYIKERVSNVEFFIFSDDLNWAIRNINSTMPCHFIADNKGEKSFNDMRLMRLCKHNIIANSSFSWWGAWLNSNESKIVIAPTNWFVAEIDTRDLLPATWVTL
jgi:hypothetical protein